MDSLMYFFTLNFAKIIKVQVQRQIFLDFKIESMMNREGKKMVGLNFR